MLLSRIMTLRNACESATEANGKTALQSPSIIKISDLFDNKGNRGALTTKSTQAVKARGRSGGLGRRASGAVGELS